MGDYVPGVFSFYFFSFTCHYTSPGHHCAAVRLVALWWAWQDVGAIAPMHTSALKKLWSSRWQNKL